MNFIVFFFAKCYNSIEGSDFLLNDNIRKYRKANHMSQDELAEKLEVTRQSISLWETGQTQPSLDNIVALAKLFDVSTDALLTEKGPANADADADGTALQLDKSAKKKKFIFIATVCFVAAALIISMFLWRNEIFGFGNNNEVKSDIPAVSDSDVSTKADNLSESNDNQPSEKDTSSTEDKNQSGISKKEENLSSTEDETQSVIEETNSSENKNQIVVPEKSEGSSSAAEDKTQPVLEETNSSENENQIVVPEKTEVSSSAAKDKTQPVLEETKNTENNPQSTVSEKTEIVSEVLENDTKKDIYGYLKSFVIQNGIINGDYCYYSNTADMYGGYSSERFSLYYWGDTDKIEFCLHSVLDDTFSINFYLYVPKQHTGNYEYISSYYYRDTGEPLYEAKGVITAGEFTKKYPLNCIRYTGSTDAQNEFMEMSRVGMCDLIDCLKNFIVVENMEYSFSDFGFVNF